ncbi:class I SAM-dependent methyltransferase [Thioclava kandeliae]|uniref:Class I SAM-dependent methyltransferase n=1 Tax=Thioclava kandeliae TaxID=3070818 RepID=A0ABV1SMG3_9RHOB
MNAFNFLQNVELYGNKRDVITRLERRYDFIIKPISASFKGAKVLDLGAHDGRWSYVFANLGAASVTAIEGRKHLVECFDKFPKTDFSNRVQFINDDVYHFLETAVSNGEQYDIVCVLGLFYHVSDHLHLLKLIKKLNPKLVIVDSDFTMSTEAEVLLLKESTLSDLNAIASYEGQNETIVGIPSFRAMEEMCDIVGFKITWHDWETVALDRRETIGDYYLKTSGKRAPDIVRSSCLLAACST